MKSIKDSTLRTKEPKVAKLHKNMHKPLVYNTNIILQQVKKHDAHIVCHVRILVPYRPSVHSNMCTCLVKEELEIC